MKPLYPILLAAVCGLAGAGGYGLGLLQKTESTPANAGRQSAPNYLSVGQFTVPIAEGGVTRAFLLAQIKLELSDYSLVAKLSTDMPRVRSEILTYFYALAKRGDVDAGVLDPQTLGRELTAMLARDLGEGAVKAVLFDRLLIQETARARGEAPGGGLRPGDDL